MFRFLSVCGALAAATVASSKGCKCIKLGSPEWFQVLAFVPIEASWTGNGQKMVRWTGSARHAVMAPPLVLDPDGRAGSHSGSVKSINEVQYRLLLRRLITLPDCKSALTSATCLSVCAISRRCSRRSLNSASLPSPALRTVRSFRTTAPWPPFQAPNTGPTSRKMTCLGVFPNND